MSTQLAKVLNALEDIRNEFDSAQSDGKKVSLADLIMLGGCTGIEQAAKNAGHKITVPFTAGRMDASLEQTDVASFAVSSPSRTASAIISRPNTGCPRKCCC